MIAMDCVKCHGPIKIQWWGYYCDPCGGVFETPLARVARWWKVFLFRSDYGMRHGLLTLMAQAPGAAGHAIRAWWRRWQNRNEVARLQADLEATRQANDSLWVTLGERSETIRDHRKMIAGLMQDLDEARRETNNIWLILTESADLIGCEPEDVRDEIRAFLAWAEIQGATQHDQDHLNDQ